MTLTTLKISSVYVETSSYFPPILVFVAMWNAGFCARLSQKSLLPQVITSALFHISEKKRFVGKRFTRFFGL